MPATNHDPHTWRELAQVVALGIQADKRRRKGKSTKAIDRKVDQIREKAEAREDARRKK